MTEDNDKKAKILLHEYASLRTEILTRTNNMFHLIVVGVVAIGWLMGRQINYSF